MINKNIVVTLFLLLIVITAGCLSDSTQSSSDVSPSGGVDTNPAVVGDDEEETRPISSQWYPIGTKEYRTGEKFQYNGINFRIAVAPNGRGTYLYYLSSEDSQKLVDSEKSLLIKIKFRIKRTNEIFEAPVMSYSGTMVDFMKGWTETIGSRATNLQPADIEWQPEFGLKNKYND